MHCEPRPVSPDSIRIWVGGADSARIAARVADYADGWIAPPAHPAAALAEGVAEIHEAAAAAGRDPAGIEIKVALRIEGGDVEASLERSIPPLAEAGATILQVSVGSLVSSAEEVPVLLERLAARFEQYR
jgi:hypothetical protein